MARAAIVLGVDDDDVKTDDDDEGSNADDADNMPEENQEAIQNLPGEI